MPIPIEEAVARIRARLSPCPPVSVPLEDALGCITAAELRAPLDQPPFPRSPLDGYAVRAADLAGASAERPAVLDVVGISPAGCPAPVEVAPGQAVRIMTGGVIPIGADCVVMQENTDGGTERVAVRQPLLPGQNYCRQGEDFSAGECLAEAGVPVTAAVLAAAAAAGMDSLRVHPRPRVAVLSTGDELRAPGQPLALGQIYDANRPYLTGRLRELGVFRTAGGMAEDDPSALEFALSAAAGRSDLIVSTGGVSVGQRDRVVETLANLGAEIVFHRVAMKPGMPAAFALLRGTPVLALSGNPFAAAVTFELLVRPALAVLSSDPRLESSVAPARLEERCSKGSSVPRFQMGRLKDGTVRLSPRQENGRIRGLSGNNCLVKLPAGDGVPAGTLVDTFGLG